MPPVKVLGRAGVSGSLNDSGEADARSSSSSSSYCAAGSSMAGVFGESLPSHSLVAAGTAIVTLRFDADGADDLRGVFTADNVPFRLARSFGSIDLRLRWPPLGMVDVSIE